MAAAAKKSAQVLMAATISTSLIDQQQAAATEPPCTNSIEHIPIDQQVAEALIQPTSQHSLRRA